MHQRGHQGEAVTANVRPQLTANRKLNQPRLQIHIMPMTNCHVVPLPCQMDVPVAAAQRRKQTESLFVPLCGVAMTKRLACGHTREFYATTTYYFATIGKRAVSL